MNGSEVSREIRRGAEYDYIKKHGLLWKQTKDSNNEKIVMDFALLHSRFDQLIQSKTSHYFELTTLLKYL